MYKKTESIITRPKFCAAASLYCHLKSWNFREKIDKNKMVYSIKEIRFKSAKDSYVEAFSKTAL